MQNKRTQSVYIIKSLIVFLVKEFLHEKIGYSKIDNICVNIALLAFECALCFFQLFQKCDNAHTLLDINTDHVQTCKDSNKWFIISGLKSVESSPNKWQNFHTYFMLMQDLLHFCSLY